MKVTAAPAVPVPSTSAKSKAWPIVATSFFFAILWLEVIRHLKGEWSLNPQYAYGWSVPFLAVYLIWRRCSARPSPMPPESSGLPIVLIALCALLFFPVQFVAEANPDWRLLSWAFALIAVAISILWIFIVGGWPWVRQFAFPFLLFLTAVPWPVRLEQIVIQDLMRAVTALNVSLLHLFGVPALQHGNVIEVGSGLIGIEEACSGVRSLQATLMISLFLGELYSFTIASRTFLVAAGALLAFVCNVARTAILVCVGAHSGGASIAAWHDPAGLTILLVCLFGLWSISLMMRRYSMTQAEPRNLDKAAVDNRLSFSPALSLVLVLWFLFTEASVQIWYRLHQTSLANAHWAVRWPASENDYKSVAIPPEAESLLRYDEGGGAAWRTSDGHYWTMYFFSWLPGRTAARFVKIHRPDICLPASGMTIQRDNGLRILLINGVSLPIHTYRFDDGGVPLHVFYCYWDARSSYQNEAAAQEEDWSARGRLRTALQGRREIGAQMLEVVVWGYQDDHEANEAVERKLAQLIRLG